MLIRVVLDIRLRGKGLNKYLFRVKGSVSYVGIAEPIMVWVSVCPQQHDHCEKKQHAITCQQCLAPPPLWSPTTMFQRCCGNVPSLLNWCKWESEAPCYSKFIFVIECLTVAYSHKEQTKNPWWLREALIFPNKLFKRSLRRIRKILSDPDKHLFTGTKSND